MFFTPSSTQVIGTAQSEVFSEIHAELWVIFKYPNGAAVAYKHTLPVTYIRDWLEVGNVLLP